MSAIDYFHLLSSKNKVKFDKKINDLKVLSSYLLDLVCEKQEWFPEVCDEDDIEDYGGVGVAPKMIDDKIVVKEVCTVSPYEF